MPDGAERPRKRPRIPGTVTSAVRGLAWPALPPPRVMALLAVHDQLQDSEWWRPERLAAMQFRQLAVLLEHARRTVPHYRKALRDASRIGPALLRSLPVLTRAQVQADPAALESDAMPRAHQPARAVRSSGSTGRPVELKATPISDLFRNALLLREQRWHRRELSLPAATIRNFRDGSGMPPEGKRAAGWVHGYATRPVQALNIRATVDEQLAWLQRVEPTYLSTFPTNARALAQAAIERGLRLPQLRQICTYSESLPTGLRELVQRAFGATLTDIYSSEEAGSIAFQCPKHEDRYHVQSENLIVEVVDDAGQPCPHGTEGRVLVTDLHNLATPLIRYAIDDYAVSGPVCDCGRGLPVLTRILGRTRNMLRMPGGHARWPSLPSGDELGRIAPVRQFQLVQKDLRQLELALVAARPLTSSEESRVRAAFLADLGGDFTLSVSCVAEIARTAGGKYEDFRCDMPAG